MSKNIEFKLQDCDLDIYVSCTIAPGCGRSPGTGISGPSPSEPATIENLFVYLKTPDGGMIEITKAISASYRADIVQQIWENV